MNISQYYNTITTTIEVEQEQVDLLGYNNNNINNISENNQTKKKRDISSSSSSLNEESFSEIELQQRRRTLEKFANEIIRIHIRKPFSNNNTGNSISSRTRGSQNNDVIVYNEIIWRIPRKKLTPELLQRRIERSEIYKDIEGCQAAFLRDAKTHDVIMLDDIKRLCRPIPVSYHVVMKPLKQVENPYSLNSGDYYAGGIKIQLKNVPRTSQNGSFEVSNQDIVVWMSQIVDSVNKQVSCQSQLEAIKFEENFITDKVSWDIRCSADPDGQLLSEATLKRIQWNYYNLVLGGEGHSAYALLDNKLQHENHKPFIVNMTSVELVLTRHGFGTFATQGSPPSLHEHEAAEEEEEYDKFEVFEGHFENGVHDGVGILYKTSFVYSGNFKDGFIHGRGRMELANGDVIAGDFITDAEDIGCNKNNPYLRFPKALGDVKVSFSSGSTYIGPLDIDYRMSGKGIFVSNTGETYEGEFRDGLYNGSGQMVNLNLVHHESFEGEWKNGQPHGCGNYINAVREYVGTFDCGEIYGRGFERCNIQDDACEEFTGLYLNGERIGYGESKYYNTRGNEAVTGELLFHHQSPWLRDIREGGRIVRNNDARIHLTHLAFRKTLIRNSLHYPNQSLVTFINYRKAYDKYLQEKKESNTLMTKDSQRRIRKRTNKSFEQRLIEFHKKATLGKKY